jgi:hypothetical protein
MAPMNAPDVGTHDAPQHCPNCWRADVAEPFHINDLPESVQYYRCGRCGFIWANREGRDREFLSA